MNKTLRKTLKEYLTDYQLDKVQAAYIVADNAHAGQKRSTGEAYISHPVSVAQILADMQLDYKTIIAAMLHDVIEDTDLDKKYIAKQFGRTVADLVDGVSKLDKIKFKSHLEAQAENFRKMMLAMAKDIRVILIKLADRLHNMRTIDSLLMSKQKRISTETLEIYAPIAARVGMHNLRLELEDLSFAVLHPNRYQVIKKAVKSIKGEHKKILETINKNLRQNLVKNGFSADSITGRKKNIYSLYKKMKNKGVSFSEIMDIYAFRIVVNNIDACYRMLGLVHSIYKPVARRFKDYIAIPKTNGYQALHTTLVGPNGVPIELQIRTVKMDKIAEYGIAAHYLYKTRGQHDLINTDVWLKSLLDIQTDVDSSQDFIENIKTDLYSDEVYVSTPKGNIVSLPGGATPIDLAYFIHTDIGSSCVACKINNTLSPLSTRLVSGQTVEIITSKGAKPNHDWLDFVATGKAKNNIRHWLKNQQYTQASDLGKRLVKQALASMNMSLLLINKNKIKQVLEQLKIDNINQLYTEVGLGNHRPILVAQRFANIESGKSSQIKNRPLFIRGTEGIVVLYASCCTPIPGDPILGLIKQGEGIEIHTENCFHINKHLRNDPKSIIHVCWESKVWGEFNLKIQVDVLNGRGVLASVASSIAASNANVVNVRVDKRDSRHNTISFILSVRNRSHLARIIRKLHKLQAVTRIVRI